MWGFNNNRQASGTSGTSRPEWKLVRNLTTDYTFNSVSADYFHTCGILDGQTEGQTAGKVLCWGHNSNGQADPSTSTFSQINAGMYHGCGLLDGQNGQMSGRVVCWGAQNDLDAENEITNTVFNFDTRANFGQADVPAALADVAFTSITAERYHTCAVRADNGVIEC